MGKNSNIEYAQNLSHELLTPLAIIRSKAELLLQSPNLTKDDLSNIDTILRTVNKMSKLNKALILLSKIDNEVFVDEDQVVLNEMIGDALENFEDQLRIKELTIRFMNAEKVLFVGNRNLLEILFTNLIKNAVFHNSPKGFIKMTLEKNQFIIENSTHKEPPDKVFKRFVSGDSEKDGLGLGLSIIKKICDHSMIKLTHEYSNNNFKVTLKF